MQDGSWYFVGYRNIYDYWDLGFTFGDFFKKETYVRERATAGAFAASWLLNTPYNGIKKNFSNPFSLKYSPPKPYHVYCFNPISYTSPKQQLLPLSKKHNSK